MRRLFETFGLPSAIRSDNDFETARVRKSGALPWNDRTALVSTLGTLSGARRPFAFSPL